MMTNKTFDTGRVKSPWIFFWIGPFAALSGVGSYLVGVDILVDGLRQPWYSQVIGMLLLLSLFMVLTAILMRGVRRNLLQIDSGRMTILHKGIFGSQRIEVVKADAEEFRLHSSDIVFDVFLKMRSGASVPIIQSLNTKRLDECVEVLSQFAPFAQPPSMNQGERGVPPNN